MRSISIYSGLLLSLLWFLSVKIISIRVMFFFMSIHFSASAHYYLAGLSHFDLRLPLTTSSYSVVSIIYDNLFAVGLDPGFGIISSFRKFSKSGLNHLSDSICSHCSPIVPYLKQFLIHFNHLVHSLSLSTFL
jgi:hypothetical protein